MECGFIYLLPGWESRVKLSGVCNRFAVSTAIPPTPFDPFGTDNVVENRILMH